MPALTDLIFTFLALLNLAVTSSTPRPNIQHPLDLPQDDHTNIHTTRPVIRNATMSDLSSLTTTFMDAFGPSPVWKYIYQFADKHPKYHRYCVQEAVSQLLNLTIQDDNAVAKVIAIPGVEDEKVISFAIWRFIDENSNTGTSPSYFINHTPASSNSQANTDSNDHTYNCTTHLDANTTRYTHINAQESHLIHTYITPTYPRRLYLFLLATHPHYDGHGYAAAQVELGLDWARERKLPVTLLASPAGYPVYRDSGFKDIKNETILFVGEEERLGDSWEEVMVWEVEREVIENRA